MPKHVRTLKAKRRERIKPFLVKLVKKGKATSAALGMSPVEALNLEAEGLIRRVDTAQTGKPGRPAVIWAPTYKAKRRLQSA